MQKTKSESSFSYTLTASEVAREFGVDFPGFTASVSVDATGRLHLTLYSGKVPEPVQPRGA